MHCCRLGDLAPRCSTYVAKVGRRKNAPEVRFQLGVFDDPEAQRLREIAAEEAA
jgi:hypothetical protein